MTTTTTTPIPDSILYDLVRSLKYGHYGNSFGPNVYHEAVRRGLIVWNGERYVATDKAP